MDYMMQPMYLCIYMYVNISRCYRYSYRRSRCPFGTVFETRGKKTPITPILWPLAALLSRPVLFSNEDLLRRTQKWGATAVTTAMNTAVPELFHHGPSTIVDIWHANLGKHGSKSVHSRNVSHMQLGQTVIRCEIGVHIASWCQLSFGDQTCQQKILHSYMLVAVKTTI